jgi:predicted RNase H-like nuclease (RuvC/YqgF family)
MGENLKASLEWLKDCAENGYIFETGDSKLLLDYITNLQNENMKYDQCLTELTDNYKDLQKELTNLQEENKKLQRQINIMEKYFELIIDIGCDYDGYNKAKSLKSLIDELVKLASLGRVANDTELMYIDNQEKHYNILNEEIEEDK